MKYLSLINQLIGKVAQLPSTNLLNNIKTVALLVLAGITVFLFQKEKEKEIIKVPVTIYKTLPPVVGKSDTVYVPVEIKKEVPNPLNQELLDKYNQAKDSIAKLQVLKEAIEEREYSVRYDDSTQTVNVYTTTQGKILKQAIDYTIKEKKVIIDTVIPVKIPAKNKIFVGGGLGLPIEGTGAPTIKAGVIIKNKKDNIIQFDIDSKKTISATYFIKIKL